jgi:hypothetical protein
VPTSQANLIFDIEPENIILVVGQKLTSFDHLVGAGTGIASDASRIGHFLKHALQ